MKKKLLLLSAFCLTLSSGSIKSQVTIGLGEAPVAGALLQLKDKEVNDASANASKGLGMPRVKLTDKNKLKPMYSYTGTDTPSATDEKAHIGLLVYHTEECTLNGKGLYVWTGDQWEILGNSTFTQTLNQTYFTLLSGRDGRGPVTPQSLIVTPTSMPTSATWVLGPGALGASADKRISFAPPKPAGGNVTTSPYTITLLPNPITDAEFATNPWISKEDKITFTNLATNCGQQKEVTINQTNYAMKVNKIFDNSQIIYTATKSDNFEIQSNVMWKTILQDPDNILSDISPAIGTENGQDLKDGSTPRIERFDYTANAVAKYQYANFVFQDTAKAKRIKDVTVSIVNCQAGTDPSLEEWAKRAGFTTAEINAVLSGTGPEDGGVSSVIRNGYQIHRDQGTDGLGANGKLFISSVFGTDPKSADGTNRWMVVNLAARSFAKGIRTGSDKATFISLPAAPNGNGARNDPHWAYPNNKGTNTYDTSPRMGLAYNWAAAAMYSQNNPETIPNLSESATPPHDDSPTRQGICPNGWHLPSDWEFTQLEMEINQNSSKYANMKDINSTIVIGGPMGDFRGKHALAMKDACPVVSAIPRGYSNPIDSRISAGFSVMLVGSVSPDGKLGSPSGYGGEALFWTFSFGGGSAWARLFTYPHPLAPDPNSHLAVRRTFPGREILTSVRCKKD